MGINLKDRFCPEPFEYLEINQDQGDIIPCHVCCFNWLPEVVGNLKEQTITEVWNSPKLQDIRRSILDGSFEYCSREFCPKIQSGSLPFKNEVEDPYLKDIIENNRTKVSKGPAILNMAMDPSCNLECPSCRTEKIMLMKEQQDQIIQKYQEVLVELLPNLKQLDCCSAGDPFASRVYRTILESLDTSENPSLSINLNTNGVLLDQVAWEKLKNIQGQISKVYISVDAAREGTYNIVRKGGDFKRLLENIRFLVSLRSQGLLDYIRLDFVIQKHNYLEFPEFIRLGKELGVDHVYFQKINDWGTYSKEEFREQAIYRPDHPLFQEFVETLNCSEVSDPIVKLGNMAELLPRRFSFNHQVTIKLNYPEVKRCPVDEYWVNLHLEILKDHFLVDIFTFDFNKIDNLKNYFDQFKKDMNQGDCISIIGPSDTPFNRFLSRSNKNDYFDRTANIWEQSNVNNKSFLWILLNHPQFNLRDFQEGFEIKDCQYISPIPFLLMDRGLRLPRFFVSFLGFLIKPFLSLLALHQQVIVSRSQPRKNL